MSCNNCGGWLDLGINDVHGYCFRCEAHVANEHRMDQCLSDDCPMCLGDTV